MPQQRWSQSHTESLKTKRNKYKYSKNKRVLVPKAKYAIIVHAQFGVSHCRLLKGEFSIMLEPSSCTNKFKQRF